MLILKLLFALFLSAANAFGKEQKPPASVLIREKKKGNVKVVSLKEKLIKFIRLSVILYVIFELIHYLLLEAAN